MVFFVRVVVPGKFHKCDRYKQRYCSQHLRAVRINPPISFAEIDAARHFDARAFCSGAHHAHAACPHKHGLTGRLGNL